MAPSLSYHLNVFESPGPLGGFAIPSPLKSACPEAIPVFQDCMVNATLHCVPLGEAYNRCNVAVSCQESVGWKYPTTFIGNFGFLVDKDGLCKRRQRGWQKIDGEIRAKPATNPKWFRILTTIFMICWFLNKLSKAYANVIRQRKARRQSKMRQRKMFETFNKTKKENHQHLDGFADQQFARRSASRFLDPASQGGSRDERDRGILEDDQRHPDKLVDQQFGRRPVNPFLGPASQGGSRDESDRGIMKDGQSRPDELTGQQIGRRSVSRSSLDPAVQGRSRNERDQVVIMESLSTRMPFVVKEFGWPSARNPPPPLLPPKPPTSNA